VEALSGFTPPPTHQQRQALAATPREQRAEREEEGEGRMLREALRGAESDLEEMRVEVDGFFDLTEFAAGIY
jgi:hypothetical protein